MDARTAFPVLIVVAVLSSGCIASTGGNGSGNGNANTYEGTGKLVVQITDQPAGNVQKLEVNISMLAVQKAGGNDSGWVFVTGAPNTFDLVAIKNINEYLGEKDLEAGKYTQIRLDVDGASVTVDGTTHPLVIPSRTVKMAGNFEVWANKTTTLTLDFNADTSVREEGNGEYSMTPVIKVTASAPETIAAERGCTDSGGKIRTAWCCKSAGNFPNTCSIGACGCSIENSHKMRVCECGKGRCFDGTKCAEAGS
jgi:hypothetical protein